MPFLGSLRTLGAVNRRHQRSCSYFSRRLIRLPRVASTWDIGGVVAEHGPAPWIFTSSGASARKFQRSVDVGMFGINVPLPVPVAYYSFGGWKSSLFGNKHIYGPEGVFFEAKSSPPGGPKQATPPARHTTSPRTDSRKSAAGHGAVSKIRLGCLVQRQSNLRPPEGTAGRIHRRAASSFQKIFEKVRSGRRRALRIRKVPVGTT